jgi:Ala-tRNA(Pro) deacylase
MSLVTEHLDARGIPYRLLEHPRATTAVDEARSIGIGAGVIAKAVVMDTRDGHVVVVVPGYRRIDHRRIRAALGMRAELATEDELQQDFPEFELGAFPAVPTLVDAPVLVDPEVMEHDHVVFAAGDQRESVEVATAALFDAPNVQVVPVASHPESEEWKDTLEV